MDDVERRVAEASTYERAKDAMLLEALILAAMKPGQVEHRPHVMAQLGRVEALRRVVETLEAPLRA